MLQKEYLHVWTKIVRYKNFNMKTERQLGYYQGCEHTIQWYIWKLFRKQLRASRTQWCSFEKFSAQNDSIKIIGDFYTVSNQPHLEQNFQEPPYRKIIDPWLLWAYSARMKMYRRFEGWFFPRLDKTHVRSFETPFDQNWAIQNGPFYSVLICSMLFVNTGLSQCFNLKVQVWLSNFQSLLSEASWCQFALNLNWYHSQFGGSFSNLATVVKMGSKWWHFG